MKIRFILYLLTWSVSPTLLAQNINWRALQQTDKHLVGVSAGVEYGAIVGVHYGKIFQTRMPLVLSGELSVPLGNNLTDDGKARLGGQLEVLHAGAFSATLKAYAVARRYENGFTRLVNFGSECAAVAGYYKARWYVAGEVGFDKAVVTHIKHSSPALDLNPGLVSGWYVPTGGNFLYGLQAGLHLRRHDVTLKVGRIISQDFKTSPLLPLLGQVGYNHRF